MNPDLILNNSDGRSLDPYQYVQQINQWFNDSMIQTIHYKMIEPAADTETPRLVTMAYALKRFPKVYMPLKYLYEDCSGEIILFTFHFG